MDVGKQTCFAEFSSADFLRTDLIEVTLPS
jgi:hypothetical protein